VDTNTVWIWLAIAASTLAVFTVFLIDWRGYADATVQSVTDPVPGTAQVVSSVGQMLLVSLLSYLLLGASIVFSWLDWRELKKRGLARPFHWAWSFFALGVSLGVYVIGRSVVISRRQAKNGWPPLWVWIAATVLTFAAMAAWCVWFVSYLMAELAPFMTTG